MQGWNSEDLQSYNRALVLEYIYQNPYISRIELAEKSALSQTTISNIAGDLMGLGLVEETGALTGKRGCKPIGLRIAPETYFTVALHLHSSCLHSILFDLAGNEVEQKKMEFEDPSALPGMIEELVGDFRQAHGGHGFLGIGIALGNTWQSDKAEALRKELSKIRCMPICLHSDAAASAYAHWMTEKKAETSSLLYVNAGSEITSALVVDGRLVPNRIGAAGEMGHMSIHYNGPVCRCKARGCLNLYASLSAMKLDMEQKRKLYPQSPVRPESSCRSIAAYYQKGDELTVAAVDTAAYYLGVGLGSLIRLLSPDEIVIGGELAACGNGYLASVQQILARFVPPETLQNTRITLEKQGYDSALVGVCHQVIHNAIRDFNVFHEINQQG